MARVSGHGPQRGDVRSAEQAAIDARLREVYQQILTRAPGWLATRGALVVELAPGQAAFVAAFAREVGFDETEVAPDLTGRDRMVIARRGGG